MQEYLLNWLPNCDVEFLRPVLTLENAVELANSGDPDQLANMVRLNWMIQDFRVNDILKPIFCRDDFQVIVGDTRIMAAKLIGMPTVPVMCYSTQTMGEICHSIDQMKKLAGFDVSAKLLFYPDVDPLKTPPEWIDIGDHRTQHHGHDQQRRLQAAWPFRGKITEQWLLQPRDWGDIFA